MAKTKQLEKPDLKTADLKKIPQNGVVSASQKPKALNQIIAKSQKSAKNSRNGAKNSQNGQNHAKNAQNQPFETDFQGMLVVPHEKTVLKERTPTILEVETAKESAKIARETSKLEPTLIQNRPLPVATGLAIETSGATETFRATDTLSPTNALDTSNTPDVVNVPGTTSTADILIDAPSFIEEPDPDEVLFEIPENALTNFELIAKRQAESKGTAIKNSEIGFVRDGATSTKSGEAASSRNREVSSTRNDVATSTQNNGITSISNKTAPKKDGETVPVSDSATSVSDEASAAYAKTIADYFAAENTPKPAPKPTKKLGPRRRKLTIFSKPKRHYSNRLSYDDLVNLEAKVGRLVFGPVPAGHHREFFEHRKNVWFWHESFMDATGAVQDTTVFYEVRPTGVFKKLLGGANYEKLEGDELMNFREAASQYLNLIRTRVYNEI